MRLKLNCLTNCILLPEEVHFFYYEIMRDEQDSLQNVYQWDQTIDEFLKENGLCFEVKDKNDIPEQPVENTLYFTIPDQKSKATAFFTHLRNAFAHFRIYRKGSFLILQDKNGKVFTMNGMLPFESLKQLCYLFFDQREKFLEQIERQNPHLDVDVELI